MSERAFPLCLVLVATALSACAASGSGVAASGGSGAGGQLATGGIPRSGGTIVTTGGASTGGIMASGGSAASTGGIVADSGVGGKDATGSGGLPNTGGIQATGGIPGSGGATGGATGSGGATGGTLGSGGAMGGALGSGGMPSTGGVRGTGGAAASGGAVSYAKCPDTTWKQVWGDEFEGASGAAADASKWTYDTGPNWYNGELQDYTSGTTNASLDGNGNLVIEARKEAREGKQYTSARLKTEGKKTFTYGRFEGRMKLPYGQGMWPAFWMLGGNSWPNTGEIDIMENLGSEPSIIHGTFHGPGYSGSAGPTASYTLPGGAKLSDDFHVFAVEWETNAIRWYIDGTLYSTKTSADIKGNTWVFDHPFFFILNLAVGGDWPGNPDATTVFPQKMLIDYVRVCQK